MEIGVEVNCAKTGAGRWGEGWRRGTESAKMGTRPVFIFHKFSANCLSLHIGINCCLSLSSMKVRHYLLNIGGLLMRANFLPKYSSTWFQG